MAELLTAIDIAGRQADTLAKEAPPCAIGGALAYYAPPRATVGGDRERRLKWHAIIPDVRGAPTQREFRPVQGYAG